MTVAFRHPSRTGLYRLAPVTVNTAPCRLSRPTLNNCSTTRLFSINHGCRVDSRNLRQSEDSDSSNVHQGQPREDEQRLDGLKRKQAQTPWHRDGSDLPPVRRMRSAGAMVKGKLLTTPSRLLKLTLPLTTTDHNSDRKDIEPLALLVHPHQPLSYLERLIQSELPTFKDGNGKEKIPAVHFRAEDSQQDETERQNTSKGPEENQNGLEEYNISGKIEKTGVIKHNNAAHPKVTKLRGGLDKGGVENCTGDGRESSRQREGKFVRWSSSTEIGDFIRDAARGKEFAVEIEGLPEEIRVGVPSFRDRTHYLRQRLRRVAGKMSAMADVKNECDKAAHRAGQRIAIGGFAGLVSWWAVVYYLTFKTDLGWDVMEPVTYLVGLSGLMGGYLFFLYHNREVSYKSALNMTISARQVKLYKMKGFDLERWESLVEEGNELRKEIKVIADEYDADWNEHEDLDNKMVMEALRKSRHRRKKGKDSEDEDDYADDDSQGQEGREGQEDQEKGTKTG